MIVTMLHDFPACTHHESPASMLYMTLARPPETLDLVNIRSDPVHLSFNELPSISYPYVLIRHYVSCSRMVTATYPWFSLRPKDRR